MSCLCGWLGSIMMDPIRVDSSRVRFSLRVFRNVFCLFVFSLYKINSFPSRAYQDITTYKHYYDLQT